MRIFGKRRFVVLAFSLLVLFWGSAFAVVKVGLDYSPPVLFAGLRSLFGGLAMVAVAVLWGGSPNLRCDWPVFLLLALFNVVLFIGLQTYAILYLPSGSAAILVYLQPILVGLLAWLILGEPLSVAKLAGLLLGFSGIVAVSAGSISGGESAISPVGVALGAGSAFFWALGTVYFKKYEARVSTLWAVALPFLIGGVMLIALGLVVEPWGEVSWTGEFVASILYSSLVGISAAWVIWFALVRAGEASRVAAYIFAVPLTAVLIGVVFLDESLRYTLLIGAALVVCGIYLVNRQPRHSKGPKAWSRLADGRSALCEDVSGPFTGQNHGETTKEGPDVQPTDEKRETRPPIPPFTEETARQKVKMAQDAWNTRDPEKVALAYTEDSQWRNRDEFFEGREAIKEFLRRKWSRELDYRLMKELWCFTGNRISVRFEYESHDTSGQWWRSHGNEHWEFDENGLMRRRDASINDYKIDESERRYHWERPEEEQE